MVHFKVLPTEERYQKLNKVQKILLSYAVGKRNEDLIKVSLNLLDQVKFYVNPEIYKAEQDAKEGKTEEYTKRNIEFEYQSQMGTETGKLKSRKYVRDAIEQFYEEDYKKVNDSKESFVITNDSGLNKLAQMKKKAE